MKQTCLRVSGYLQHAGEPAVEDVRRHPTTADGDDFQENGHEPRRCVDARGVYSGLSCRHHPLPDAYC